MKLALTLIPVVYTTLVLVVGWFCWRRVRKHLGNWRERVAAFHRYEASQESSQEVQNTNVQVFAPNVIVGSTVDGGALESGHHRLLLPAAVQHRLNRGFAVDQVAIDQREHAEVRREDS